MNLKASTIVSIAVVLPALLSAYPGFGGGRGLFRVQNAMVEPEAGLTISLHSLARNGEFDTTGRSGWIADCIAPELSYAPMVTNYVGIELFGSWGGAFQTPKSVTAQGSVWGFTDLKAGGKLSVPVLRVLKLGGIASYTLRSRDIRSDWQVLDSSALPRTTGLAWGGLVTLNLQDITTPAPNLIFNVGRVSSGTQYASAVELQGEQFCLFVEALSEQPDGESDGLFDTRGGHVQVTPGITIGTATSVFVKAGYTVSLDDDSNRHRRPNEIILGLGIGTPLGRHRKPEYGKIVGSVSDAATGAPLAAAITFPDHPRLGRLITDPHTGVFKATKVPVGAVTVQATADGHESRSVPLMVESGKPSTTAIMLPMADTAVEVMGRVSDRKTGQSLAATVMLPDADSTVLKTDPATGIYRTRLMPRGYSVIVESPGYLKQTTWLQIERDRPLARDFRLVAEGMVITLRGIYFEFDKATITPESRPALEDAAKILIQNPTIMVEIQGHTDSVGSDMYNQQLSERRAKAVVNYLVQELGIEGSRLTARGYGESQPVADNTAEEGRALNRRVEFVITGQTGQIAPDR
jgi:outer membrane protein OmpA-like peptidoglycan-associated protein